MHVFSDLWIQWSNCPFFVAKKDLHWNCLAEKGKSGYFCQDAKFCSTPTFPNVDPWSAWFNLIHQWWSLWSTFKLVEPAWCENPEVQSRKGTESSLQLKPAKRQKGHLSSCVIFNKNTMKKMSLVVVFEAGIPKLLAQIFPIALFNEGSKSGSNFLSFHDCFIHKQVTPLVYIGLSI